MKIGFISMVLDGAFIMGCFGQAQGLMYSPLVVVVYHGNSVLCPDCGTSAFLSACS